MGFLKVTGKATLLHSPGVIYSRDRKEGQSRVLKGIGVTLGRGKVGGKTD